MRHEQAGEVLGELGLTMKFVLPGFESAPKMNKAEMRKYQFLFGKIRQAATILEYKAKMFATKDECWTDPDDETPIALGLTRKDFFVDKYGIGRISSDMKKALKSIDEYTKGWTISYVKSKVNRRYSIYQLISEMDKEVVTIRILRSDGLFNLQDHLKTIIELIDNPKIKVSRLCTDVILSINHTKKSPKKGLEV